jgi:hypothetical protein
MYCSKKYIFYFLKSLLFFLFIGYYSSISMFYHAHLVNGIIISHSHPFKHEKKNQSPFKSHSHSSSAYYIIQHLNKTTWKDTSVIVVLPEPAIISFAWYNVYLSPTISTDCFSLSQLRAPPVTC